MHTINKYSVLALLFSLLAFGCATSPTVSDLPVTNLSEQHQELIIQVDTGVAPHMSSAALESLLVEGNGQVNNIEVVVSGPPRLEGMATTFNEGMSMVMMSLCAPAFGAGTAGASIIFAYGGSGALLAGTLDAPGQRKRHSASSTMEGIDFGMQTGAVLSRLIDESGFGDESGNYSLLVLIEDYGFAGKPVSEHACIFVEATFIIFEENTIIHADKVEITNTGRSPDAPPPFCARQKEFLSNDGALIADVLNDTAYILASIVASRTGALK